MLTKDGDPFQHFSKPILDTSVPFPNVRDRPLSDPFLSFLSAENPRYSQPKVATRSTCWGACPADGPTILQPQGPRSGTQCSVAPIARLTVVFLPDALDQMNAACITDDQWMPVLAVKPDGTKLFLFWHLVALGIFVSAVSAGRSFGQSTFTLPTISLAGWWMRLWVTYQFNILFSAEDADN